MFLNTSDTFFSIVSLFLAGKTNPEISSLYASFAASYSSNILGNKESDFSYNGDIYVNEIKINRRSITERDISMIFQNDLLFPHMTIIQNLNFVNKSSNLKAIDL